MRKLIYLSLTITLVFMSSCSAFYDALPLEKNVDALEYVNETEDSVETINIDETETGFYDLFITKEDVTMSLYEPIDGCYTGAYINEDVTITDGISEFEEKTGENGFYAEYMKLGGEYPYTFVYECIKSMKTPVLIIEPPETGSAYDEELLLKTAVSVGALKVPVFVVFYPVTEKSRFDVDGYIRFFRTAYDTFKQNAENAAVIWSIPHYDVQNKNAFYPGDKYTDWVGLSVYANISAKETVHASFYDSLDYFYFLYQNFKPVFLTVGISHYSTVDNRYYIDETAGAITEFYNKLEHIYPRVKAVMYMNKDTVLQGGNNYLVTEDDEIKDYYKKAISDDYFLKSISDNDGIKTEQMMRSAFKALKIEDKYYIAANSVRFEFGERLKRKAIGDIHDYDFSQYYDAADILPVMNLDLFEDADNMSLHLSER